MAKKSGLVLTDDVYRQVLDRVRESEAPLAYFQPKFIIGQEIASCKFEGTEPVTPDNVEDALCNLFIRKADGRMSGSSGARARAVRLESLAASTLRPEAPRSGLQRPTPPRRRRKLEHLLESLRGARAAADEVRVRA